MKIEILSTTNDTRNGEYPTHIRITSENGEVIEINVEDDSDSNHTYTPYLEVYKVDKN